MIQPRASSTSRPSSSTSETEGLADETPVAEHGASAERRATGDQVRIEITMDKGMVDALRSVLAGRDGDVEDLARDLLRQAYFQMAGGDGATSDSAPFATPSTRSKQGQTEEAERRPSDCADSMSPATAMRQLHRAVRAAQEATDPLDGASHHGDGERFDPPPEVGGTHLNDGASQNATDDDASSRGAGDPEQNTLPAFVLDILSRLGEDGDLDDAGADGLGAAPDDADSCPSGTVGQDASHRDASMFDVVHDDRSLEPHGEEAASPSGKDACTDNASASDSSSPAPTIQLPRASLLRQTYRA
ncbi:MAG: hypothetical protein GVY25_15480 [Bacteroidetes bacterium]|jgi:hypothetical protein|nr:hypothetical protein [Bacteroidota bacterium]